MRVRTELRFEEIKENTNEKELARKIDDQEKWSTFFNKIVTSYFSDRTFNGFHPEFDPAKHRLDCKVPSRGQFKCHQLSNPGSKKSKRKLKMDEEPAEQAKEEKEPVEKEDDEKKKKKTKFVKDGCGQSWNSNLCLTKFNCLIEDGNTLVVQLREYGQRCRHCEKRYENPSFINDVLDIMLYWLLNMILEGIFDVVDHSIAVDPEDMGYYRRRWRPKKVQVDEDGNVIQDGDGGGDGPHNKAMCEACVNGKGCGRHSMKKKPRKRRNRGRGNRGANQNHQDNNGGTQPRGENAGGGQQQQGDGQQERGQQPPGGSQQPPGGSQQQSGGNSHTQRRRRQRQRQRERQNNQQE